MAVTVRGRKRNERRKRKERAGPYRIEGFETVERYYSPAMLTNGDIALALLAAFMIGLSKTAIPGGGLLATPVVAVTFHGRGLPGATLGILLMADVLAVRTYRQSARWDVLRPLVPWVTGGFALGAWFFIAIGKSGRTLDIVIASMILLIVMLQVWRIVRQSPPAAPSLGAAGFFGTTGGFATFVSNNAGPILNTYFTRLGLSKEEFVGSSSWFYFIVNVAKVPIYVALGWWSTGGAFFTRRSLLFDLASIPGVLAGVFLGRWLFHRIKQQTFLGIVLVLSAAGAIKLLLGK
jgi:uncharacterized protein